MGAARLQLSTLLTRTSSILILILFDLLLAAFYFSIRFFQSPISYLEAL